MMRKVIFTTVWLLLTIVPVLAQATCPALVNQALDAIGDNCAELDRNSACYGYDRVDTLFTVQQPADFFSQPSDRTELINLQSIKTFPLDTATGRFGVAVLNAQANVPESLPGQGILFLLVGDAEMTNAVAPEDAAQPVEAIDVTTASETPLFSLPSTTSNTRDTVAAGTTLQTDGFNATGEFLRVIVNSDIAWVPVAAITPADAIDSLPTLSSAEKTPMQAFYFSTGVGQPACNEAEATLAVQSPENITVDITVNGVDIQVGSLVTFTNNSITVHRGHVETSLGQSIDANETLELDRDEDGNFVGDGSVRPISDEEFARGEKAQDGLNDVAENNGWETEEVTPRDETPDQPPNTEVLPDGTIIHIVQRGESLYGIAELYDTSMQGIIDCNDIVDPFVIYTGQRLCIPNPGSGFVAVAVRPNPTGDGTVPPTNDTGQTPPTGNVNCAGFRILSGGGSIISTFSWTPVEGADQYKINLFGASGNYVTSVLVNAPTTAIDLNMGDYGTGESFQWEVEALQAGNSFCNTGRSAMAAKPTDRVITPVPGKPFTARRVCKPTPDQAVVFWDNAQQGANVTVFAADSYFGPDYTATFPSAPTGQTLADVGTGIVLIQVYSDKGDFINLPGCP